MVAHKGYTNYAIAMPIAFVVDAIARNTLAVLPVSVLIDGHLGVRDVCLSMPSVIGRGGIVRTLPIDLSDSEAEALRHSAATLRGVIHSVLL